MAGTRPWVAWYPADILNDPKYLCLSRPARLVYRELLDRMWLSECALPNDPRKLAALAGLTELEFQQIWSEMQDPSDPCFIEHPVKEKSLTNKRLYREWEHADQLAEISRENGKRGGRPPNPQNPGKTQRVSSGVPRRNPDESYPHPQSQLQEEDPNGSSTPDGVPACPHKAIIALYHEILPELRQVKIWKGERPAWLRTRWREDVKRQNLGWWREYFSLVRRSPHLMGQNDRQWQADLEWLIRPQNMTKVIEGRYLDNGSNLLSIHGQRQAAACAKAIENMDWGDE